MLRRTATARAIRVLRSLSRKGVEVYVTGSLVRGDFDFASDVDFVVTDCPRALRYAIEAGVEDVMGRFEFDVAYADELTDAMRTEMLSTARSAAELLEIERERRERPRYGAPFDTHSVEADARDRAFHG